MQDPVKIRPAVVFGAGAIALVVGFVGGFALKRLPTDGSDAAPQWAREQKAPAAAGAKEADAQTRYLLPVSDTQPQRGSADALVTVVEWCDLRGDPCRAADTAMTSLMGKYKGRLRWVFRHHVDPENFAASQRLHAFARGAMQIVEPDDPEKFWQVRDKLLALPGAEVPDDNELRRIAKEVGADFDAIMKGVEAKAYTGGLAIDSSFEKRFGVTAAPAFFVNGRRVPLAPKVEMTRSIDALIQQEMVTAKRLADSGITGPALYEELTKNGLWALNDDPSKHPPSRFATRPAPSAMSTPREN